MLVTRKLVRRFGARYIFNGIDCEFGVGCHAIMGDNGAGKSTLLRTLAGIDAPESGDVLIDGMSLVSQPTEARQRLYYVPDRPVFYEHMRGQDLINTVLRLRGLKQKDLGDVAEQFNLAPLMKLRLLDMSLGMQRRIYFALAFIGKGAILLDEPSNGLDGAYREILLEQIALKSIHSAIIFSSHDEDFIRTANAQRWHLHEGCIQNFSF